MKLIGGGLEKGDGRKYEVRVGKTRGRCGIGPKRKARACIYISPVQPSRYYSIRGSFARVPVIDDYWTAEK
jgi:hypothetical protein